MSSLDRYQRVAILTRLAELSEEMAEHRRRLHDLYREQDILLSVLDEDPSNGERPGRTRPTGEVAVRLHETDSQGRPTDGDGDTG